MNVRLLLLSILALVMSAGTAAAQTYGQITGQVTDASGAVIPGASVTIINVDRQTARKFQTNELGYYTATNLDPGNYEVRIEKEGFQTKVQAGIRLEVNQYARVDISLNLGAVSETVRVVAEVPLIDTSTAQLGTVITEEKVADLPLNGRNFTQLILLTPGAAPISVAQNAGGGQAQGRFGIQAYPALNGQTNRSNYFTLDGVYNTGHFTTTYAVAPSIDLLNEFKVQSQSDQAEFGGVTGGVVNLSTKSGTNAFHGTAYEFVRNDALDSRDFFHGPKPPLRQNQFGATLGGPAIKNKTFFFWLFVESCG